MKLKILIRYSIALFLCVSVVSCGKDDGNSNNSDNSSLTSNLITGTWKITNFIEDGKNQKAHFSNFQFDFEENNTVLATSGSNIKSGTWNLITDSGKTKLVFDFGNIDKFEELNEDWEVLSQSNSKIDLKHVSGGNGGVDLLTFERN